MSNSFERLVREAIGKLLLLAFWTIVFTSALLAIACNLPYLLQLK